MAQRQVTRTMVHRVVRSGALTDGPYLDIHGRWRVEMEGRSAGDILTVALAIEWRTRLLVVTVIKRKA